MRAGSSVLLSEGSDFVQRSTWKNPCPGMLPKTIEVSVAQSRPGKLMLQGATTWQTSQKFSRGLGKEIIKVGPTKITLTPRGPEGCVHMQDPTCLGENREGLCKILIPG